MCGAACRRRAGACPDASAPQRTTRREEGAGRRSCLRCRQPGIEAMAREPRRAARHADDAGGRPGAADARCRPTSARAIGKAIEADVKKYVDEAVPLRARTRDQAGADDDRPDPRREVQRRRAEAADRLARVAGATRSTSRSAGEMQTGFMQKLVAEARPLLDPKLQALDTKVRGTLGVPPPGAAKAARRRRSRPPSAGQGREQVAPERHRAAVGSRRALLRRRGRPATCENRALAMADSTPAIPPDLLDLARPDRRGRPRTARAAEPARRAGAAGRRGQEARRLGGVPPRARSRR